MSIYISNDDLFNNYYLTDPFGFTVNTLNRTTRNTNHNNRRSQRNKKRYSSFDGFLHTFSFLSRNHNTTEDNNKKKNNENKRTHMRTLSTPTLPTNVSSKSNINDNINNINLKKYSCKYSDLIDTQVYQPHIEVEENNNFYRILVYLPDVRKEEINLEISNNNIVIYGERTRKITKNCTFNKFNRTFTIPDDTSSEALKANFKNDLLELIFQKNS
ncbi:hypothetical protein BCR32DRAFT_289786 [Anaeromyces robustus]|uniref:SHSP domain-containing protein n=1 Tax=Anaeromyces robustus TaxID=1754192 RepID=A0A1Y1XMD9_9FUNG|nr:hypothetical protein BCR32DRAFT_289786 [Anaeromyces robustus]|eukprot:ORX86855.1 hypothetical protein BCR32DRAFT_289786 [Anaeromyces robustus]